MAEVLDHAEVCVIGSTDPAVLDGLDGFRGKVIDLVRVPGAATHRDRRDYVGIGW
ncbi:hypothetical protein ACFSTC_54230 [Nonomuraea ferruginea]